MGFMWCDQCVWLCSTCLRQEFCVDGCVCIVPLLIKAYRHVSPPSLDLPSPSLSSLIPPLLCVCLPSLWRSTFPADIPFLSYILFRILVFFLIIHFPSVTHSIPPSARPCFHHPKVILTGRPSMRIQCWRLKGAGSWSSSLSRKASSHLKVSATSEVCSQAPAKGVISFLSVHVCDWVVCICVCMRTRDCVCLYSNYCYSTTWCCLLLPMIC